MTSVELSSTVFSRFLLDTNWKRPQYCAAHVGCQDERLSCARICSRHLLTGRLMRFLSRLLSLAIALGLPLPLARAQGNNASATVSVIPRPESLVLGRGVFALTPRTTIWSDRADSAVARRFSRSLAPATTLDLRVRVGTSASGNRIVFRRAAASDTTLGSEGYRLDVRPGVVTITASAAAGAFYATQTLLQLLPPDIYRAAPMSV